MTYTDTNYDTLCRYLWSVVHHAKKVSYYMCTDLEWQECLLKKKWNDMH
jgi:hypothetical protein